MRIQRIPTGLLSANCYLIETQHSLVMVDPGGSADVLIEAIEKSRKRLEAVLLTHSHFDHILALPAISRRFGDFHLGIHALEKNQVSEPGIRRFLSDADPSLLSLIGEDFSFPKVTHELHDHDVVTDASLLVLHTPGHSPGSVCLYSREQGFLFCGDTLFRGTVGRTDLPGGNTAQLMQSIQQQLLPLDEETAVYPGHGESTTIGYEKRTNRFLS